MAQHRIDLRRAGTVRLGISLTVMPGFVPATHVFPSGLDVGGRDEPGHDEWNSRVQRI
jgi:hypothetical protein